MAALVSIIIPVFNQAEFLEQAIDSAQAQTYTPFQVFVVNDGSTDGSRDIARGYGSAVQKLVDQGNKGLAGARNAGVMNSHGEFILPLDADDWISPDYLQKTVPLMQGFDVGVVATDWKMFGVEDRVIRIEAPTLEMEMRANYLPVCSLIRREAFLQTGGYNHRAPVYEDWSLWIDILKRGWRVAVVQNEAPLFHYRRRHESMVNSSAGQHAKLHELVKKLHPELAW